MNPDHLDILMKSLLYHISFYPHVLLAKSTWIPLDYPIIQNSWRIAICTSPWMPPQCCCCGWLLWSPLHLIMGSSIHNKWDLIDKHRDLHNQPKMPPQTQWSHWAMLQQLWGSYAKLRRNDAKLRRNYAKLRRHCCAKIRRNYATRHYLIDLAGEFRKKTWLSKLHVNPRTTTRATTFGRTGPKYYQLVSVCIEISESKFLTRM